MGLVDELRQRNNSSVSSPIFGNNSQVADDGSSLLPLYERKKRIDLEDFKAREQFMNGLSLQREGLKTSLDANKPMNTAYGGDIKDQNAISPFQQEGFNIDRSRLDFDKQKALRENKIDEGKLDLGNKELALDTIKNKNVFDTKQADLERKSEDSNRKLELAYAQLEKNRNDSAALIQFHDAQRAAADAKHALDLNQRDKVLAETTAHHEATISEMQKRLEEFQKPTEETEYDANGKVVGSIKKSKSSNTPAKPGDSMGIRK